MDETRILRGAALANHGDSYLDRAQSVAELESEMKLQRFMRDIPKHQRSSFNYDDPLATEDGTEEEQSPSEAEYGEDAEEMRYDRLEDLFNMNRSEAFQEAISYEPVMYRLVKELDRRNQKELSLIEIQEGFLNRTERLMRQHQ